MGTDTPPPDESRGGNESRMAGRRLKPQARLARITFAHLPIICLANQ
jgi:hypothetical protein